MLFDDESEVRAASVEFLRDGRRLGQRLIYAGNAGEEELREDIAGLPGLDRLLVDGSLELVSLPELYPVGEPIDPEAQVATYAAATEEALADGYTGLRVAAEATSLATEPEYWEALTRYESVVDHYMATNPCAAMCCYDRRAVPEHVVSDLSCVHPAATANERIAPFRLFSRPGALMLAGKVDRHSVEDLDRLLALVPRGRRETVLDLSLLESIDDQALISLAERAGARGGGGLRLVGAQARVLRRAELPSKEL